MRLKQETNEAKKEEDKPGAPKCFHCGRPKIRKLGFGTDYTCPNGCGSSVGISSFN